MYSKHTQTISHKAKHQNFKNETTPIYNRDINDKDHNVKTPVDKDTTHTNLVGAIPSANQ